MKKNNRFNSLAARKLDVQRLEERRLMAGDVAMAVSVSGSNIDVTLTGDSNSNGVEVRQIGSNLRITGLNQGGSPTTISGAAVKYVPMQQVTQGQISFLDDLRINMGPGSDRVFVSDLNMNFKSHSDLEVNTGSGSDRLSLYNVDVARNINLDDHETDAGVDVWILDEVEAGNDINAEMHAGRDFFFATDTNADKLDVDTGAHRDYVSLDGVDVGELEVKLGSGNDRLRIEVSDANFASLDGGSGFDTLDADDAPNYFDVVGAASGFETILD